MTVISSGPAQEVPVPSISAFASAAERIALPKAGNISGDVAAITQDVLGGNFSSAIERVLTATGVIGGEPEEVIVPSGAVAGAPGGSGSQRPIITSPWGNLSPYLLATFYPCNADGIQLENTESITAPITEANLDIQLNWQSPFENAGPESKAPALMSMIQTGGFATVASALQSVLPTGSDGKPYLNGGLESIKNAAKDLEGRTGITKLNSRQVFSGMPPFKMPMTLHLRAMESGRAEVLDPYIRFLEWAMPQQLAKDGYLAEIIKAAGPNQTFIKSLFPSLAPLMIGFTYGGERYAPMVIESISHPIDGPRDSSGYPIYRAMQITLATLTALDRNDIARIFNRGA